MTSNALRFHPSPKCGFILNRDGASKEVAVSDVFQVGVFPPFEPGLIAQLIAHRRSRLLPASRFEPMTESRVREPAMSRPPHQF